MWTRNWLILDQRTVSDPAFQGCRTLGEAFAALENASVLRGSTIDPSGRPSPDVPGIDFKIDEALKDHSFTQPPEFPAAKASLLRVLRWICAANDCDARLTPESVEVITRQKESSRDLLTRPGRDELRLDERLRRLENTVLRAFAVENATLQQTMKLLQRAVDQADVAAGRTPAPLNIVALRLLPALAVDGSALSFALRDVRVHDILQYCASLAQHELKILPEVIEYRPISTQCGEAVRHEFKLAKAPVAKLLANQRRFPAPPDRFLLTGSGGSYDRATGVFIIENVPTFELASIEHFLWCLGALETRADSRPLLRQKLSPVTGKAVLPRLSLNVKSLNEAVAEVERLAAAAGKKLRLIVQGSQPVQTDIWLDWQNVSLDTALYYLAQMSDCEATASGTEVIFRPLER